MKTIVSPEKMKALRKRMRGQRIFEKDMEERFTRSSGPGGQNVNKVDTCVHLVHRPTGISVKCQQERFQGLNRYLARILLVEKIEKERLKEEKIAKYEKEKKRRQTRKRSKKSKEAMLADKHHRSHVKAERRIIRESQINKVMEEG